MEERGDSGRLEVVFVAFGSTFFLRPLLSFCFFFLNRLSPLPPRQRKASPSSTCSSRRITRSTVVLCRASKGDDSDSSNNALISTALSAATAAIDAAASLVPDSVPRPVAKGGVAAVGAILLVSFVGKLISTVVFLTLLAAGGYFLLQQQGAGGSGSGKKKGGSGSSDALAEARRIMDKYK